MNWFATTKTVRVTLQPDETGTTVAGFHSGKSLTIQAKVGETIHTVLDRFNTYRGPNTQIHTLWLPNGTKVPFSTILTSDIVLIVKFASV